MGPDEPIGSTRSNHRNRNMIILGGLALVMVATTLFGARVAEADSTWFQSYQRGSASEACVAQAGETPWQDSWGTNPGWSPSWEQWANNRQGGWVCSRSITWARTPEAAGSSTVTYALGDIGPGGGLVFYIDSVSGLRYEMAPKNWGVSGAIDPIAVWITSATKCYATNSSDADQNCQINDLYPGTSDAQSASMAAATAIGMGSANTDAIIARMVAGIVSDNAYAAGLARAYAGVDGLTTGWFLPSKDELNAMYTYSLVGGFDTARYGFASDFYWSSSQNFAHLAWYQYLDNGGQSDATKSNLHRVRPVRAF